MILTMAWRNIWRSKTRSMVVMGAIILGVWAVIFLISFSSGMVNSYINNAIENETSHIQIHNPAFLKDMEVRYHIGDPEAKLQAVEREAGVRAATLRSLTNAMLASSKGARGVRIRGIELQAEAAVSNLHEKIVEGKYLEEEERNPILVSRRLADKLKVKLRSKVVLTFQDLEGEITAAAFRISGLFDSGNTPFDESMAFIRRKDLNRLLGSETLAHEVALLLEDPGTLDATTVALRSQLPRDTVETYRQLSPDVELYESQIQLSATIFMVIVMLALVFGIINNMLMTVLERYKELGMLMAIGMNKVRVFFMIVLETVMLGIVAAPLGLLLGYLTVKATNKTGIDLSAYSDGMREFGLAVIVYPELESQIYWQLALAVAITAIVGSIYPAYKAVRLRPVEAMRKI